MTKEDDNSDRENQSLGLNTLKIIREQVYGWTEPDTPKS